MELRQKMGFIAERWDQAGAGRLTAGESDPQVRALGTAPPRPVDLIISQSLRYGVLISCVLIAVGVAAFLLSAHDGSGQPTLSAMLAPSVDTGAFRSPIEVLSGLSRREPNAFVGLGLLVLMITPLVPLVVSAVASLIERDRPYVFITLIVLGVLATSFLLSLPR
ncbi:MAG: DUF1634 domain-containing protein [Chloroflexi bacterium]|nr:DUF1634 domain-containing protein [Chloroflexota bacterium]